MERVGQRVWWGGPGQSQDEGRVHHWYEESLERGGAATRFLRIALTDKRQFPYLYDGDVARRRLMFDRGTYHVTLSEFEVALVRSAGSDSPSATHATGLAIASDPPS